MQLLQRKDGRIDVALCALLACKRAWQRQVARGRLAREARGGLSGKRRPSWGAAALPSGLPLCGVWASR